MTKTKRLTSLLLVAALMSISVGLIGSSAALAAPSARTSFAPMAGKLDSVQSGVLAAGKYSYIVAFSDSADNADSMQDPADGASFNASVPQVYAWIAIKRNDTSAPATDFPADIKFSSPDGLSIKSTYVGNKQTITPGNQQYDKGSLVGKSVVIKGSANAEALGTWSVTFMVGGQSLTTESFTLLKAGAPTNSGTPVSQSTPIANTTPTSGDTSACTASGSNSDPATQVHDCLVGLGYTVQDTGQTTLKDGNKVAYVYSDMADPQRDFYSADTSAQLFYSYAAMAGAWPDSDGLATELSYSKQYTIIAVAKMSDWQDFAKNVDLTNPSTASNSWGDFSGKLIISIYDENTKQILTPQETTDFANKNFGSGSNGNPGNTTDPGVPIGDPNHPTNSSVGRVSVAADTISLPPDGSSTSVITVKVYDRKSKPLANQEVSFTLSGGGKLKPTMTSTDSNGVAKTTYTAGTKAAQVTIVAQSEGVRGSASINLSQSDAPQNNNDDPATAVQSSLTAAGYDVVNVGLLKDNTTAYAIMPRASSSFDDNLVKQVLTGWGALYDAYKDKDCLVITSFNIQGTNYGVLWFISNTELGTVIADLNDGSDAKTTEAKGILSTAINKYQVINLDTGEAVSDSKDFVNKNFGG